MARRIRWAELESRTARDRLKTGGKVHWRALDPGKLSLGYRRRKSATPGEWLKRVYEGSNGLGGGRYKQSVIAIADDFSDADGDVNNFRMARKGGKSEESTFDGEALCQQ